MRHLSPEELLDIAEGSALQAPPAHLTSCETCRKQLADLRAMMAAVTDVDVPEPSPLFWDHLSARVREAVAEDVPARRFLGSWSWRLVAPLSAAAIAAAVIVAVALRPAVVEGPAAGPASSVVETAGASGADLDGSLLADDPTFSLVSDLAGDIDIDTALAAGLASDGSAEHALIHMTSSELMELEELVKAEMPGSQAS